MHKDIRARCDLVLRLLRSLTILATEAAKQVSSTPFECAVTATLFTKFLPINHCIHLLPSITRSIDLSSNVIDRYIVAPQIAHLAKRPQK